jgi:hypothetical protein
MNSCAGSLLPGANNITNEPQFVNEGAGDFHLAAGSPCRNTGSNQFAAMPWDLAGMARIAEGVVDMGAYEFIGGSAIVVIPSVVNFGTLVVDEASTASVSIINGGSGVLTGAVSGVQAPFSLLGTSAYVLPDGAGTGITFMFAPSSIGVFSNVVACSGGGGTTVLLTGAAVPEPMMLAGIALLTICNVAAKRRKMTVVHVVQSATRAN